MVDNGSGRVSRIVDGPSLDGVAAPAMVDGARLAQTFCTDLRNLQDVLEPLLRRETLAQLNAVAGNCNPLHVPDDLWASTVYDFLLAHHRGVMRREHIARALVSLYLGRTGSFLTQHSSSTPAEADAALEALCLQFEQLKPAAVAEWSQASSR